MISSASESSSPLDTIAQSATENPRGTVQLRKPPEHRHTRVDATTSLDCRRVFKILIEAGITFELLTQTDFPFLAIPVILMKYVVLKDSNLPYGCHGDRLGRPAPFDTYDKACSRAQLGLSETQQTCILRSPPLVRST